MIEILIHGRGGQGAVMASTMLAEAYFRTGFFVQTFPLFGTERRGTPVVGFTRVDKDRIFQKFMIKKGGHIIVLDNFLFKQVDLYETASDDAVFVVNAPRQFTWPSLTQTRWARCDANSIAQKYGLGSPLNPIVNTTMLGAYCRACPELELERMCDAIQATIKSHQQANLDACRCAYDTTEVL